MLYDGNLLVERIFMCIKSWYTMKLICVLQMSHVWFDWQNLLYFIGIYGGFEYCIEDNLVPVPLLDFTGMEAS